MKRIILGLLLCLLATSVNAAVRFAVCTVACTWDASSTAMWSTSTGGATGASVPGSGDSVTLDAATCVGGVTCTITVNTTVTVLSITMGACTAATTGCILDFSVNNNNVTLSASAAFSGTGTGTRTLKMGSGTWTLTTTTVSTTWTLATTTNLTFDAGTSTIVYSGVSATNNRIFSGGGLTYGSLTLSATGGGAIVMAGTNTFSNINITGQAAIAFPISVTTTITNAFTWTATSGSEIFATSATLGTVGTVSIASGSPTMSWAGVRDLTFTGGASFTATNSFDLGHNSGITITAPAGGAASGGRIIGG